MKFNAGQHTATIIPDQYNNADTVDILFYDNNVVVSRGDKALSKKYSRAAQYRINEKDKTVDQYCRKYKVARRFFASTN